MDLLHPLVPLQLIVGILAFLIFISYHRVFSWAKKNRLSYNTIKLEAPEPGFSWPVIGHLHLLKGPEPFSQKLDAMAEKHGPVFMLRLGAHRTLVVSGAEAIKECWTTNDRALASRPHTAIGEYLCYNNLMFGQATYGPYWRELRKISMIHLLSNTRQEMLKHVRAAEIDDRIKGLYRRWEENHGRPVKVEMKRWLNEMNFSVISKMVVGKRFVGACGEGEGKELRRLIDEFFRLMMVFVATDVFPFLKWIDWKGQKRVMKKTAGELDSILGKLLEEHRCKKKKRVLLEGGGDKVGKEEEEEEDFMDVMLSIMEDDAPSPLSGYDTDTVIKASTWGILLATSDSTSITLAGAVFAVVTHPHVLKRLQDELDTHVGNNRHVEESDIDHLAYLQAIIKETLRFGPTGTVLPPREAMQDCEIGGYRVRAGTRVLFNLGKVHRDPAVWSDPLQFRPERWFQSRQKRELDVKGQQFEYVPFGSGRRSCPGISFAMKAMHLTLARLVHGFELGLPVGAPHVDLGESLRLDNPNPTPVELLFTPRLPLHLYEDELHTYSSR